MGLNNSNANNGKKERLLVDEVNVNNGEILMYLDVDYKNRVKACEEINKRFGLNVKVSKNIENSKKNIHPCKKCGTLTDEEVMTVFNGIAEKVCNTYKAEVRDK